MRKFWPDDTFYLYKNACEMLNYPHIPFGIYLQDMIQQEDTTLDIGCGFGFTSMYISKLCHQVIALDQDRFALQKLEQMTEERDISNITTITGIFPDVQIHPVDVVIALYVPCYDEKFIDWVIRICKRSGIITLPSKRPRASFHSDLSQKLGIERKIHKIYEHSRTYETLEKAGFTMQIDEITHEFGQPVKDIEEAVRFLAWQVCAQEEHMAKIKELAANYIKVQNGEMYIPMMRSSEVVRFEHS